MLDRAPASLAFTPDRVASPDKATIALTEVAAEFDRIGKSRRVRGFFDLTDYFPADTRPEYVPLFVTGAHAAEVEVDLRTGETRACAWPRHTMWAESSTGWTPKGKSKAP